MSIVCSVQYEQRFARTVINRDKVVCLAVNTARSRILTKYLRIKKSKHLKREAVFYRYKIFVPLLVVFMVNVLLQSPGLHPCPARTVK